MLECFLLTILHVSVWKSVLIIVKRYLLFLFSSENPGFLFDVTYSNPYFSFDIEISAVNRCETQQSVIARDDCGVYFAIGYAFHRRHVLWKVCDGFDDRREDKKTIFSIDGLVVGCCFPWLPWQSINGDDGYGYCLSWKLLECCAYVAIVVGIKFCEPHIINNCHVSIFSRAIQQQ